MKSNTLQVVPNSDPLQPSAPPTPSFQLQKDIQSKNFERHRLNPLPNLAPLRERIVDLTALQAVKPDKPGIAADLYEAQTRFSEATDRHALAQTLDAEIRELEQQLQAAFARERAEAANASTRRLQAALEEYNAMSHAAAKAFRELIRANTLAQQTPGSQSITLPVGFNIPHLAYDHGVTTPLGSQMVMGLMSWEQQQ